MFIKTINNWLQHMISLCRRIILHLVLHKINIKVEENMVVLINFIFPVRYYMNYTIFLYPYNTKQDTSLMITT